VTPSDHERHVFSNAYGIPLERFAFEHWGIGPPTVPDPAALPGEFVDWVAQREPFFCAIGRNNRDFRTFAEALRGAPYHGVIVAMRGLFDNEEVPPNVTVLHDLPYDQCQHLIAHSVANVVPVKESGIGAGHITMVHAMHMGKAQIVTTLPALADYFLPGEHGLGVGRGSVEEMRAAMDHMLGHPEEAARMGAAARAYAARWLSGNHHVPMMCAILDALEGKAPFPDSPPGWREWKAGLAKAENP
jgi:glycosyltransferase involved in cell wall biosynthesis